MLNLFSHQIIIKIYGSLIMVRLITKKEKPKLLF